MKYLYLLLTILLLVCLFPMPYGYYSIVRVVAMLAFAWLAYRKYESKEELLMIVFIGLAILFQPFLKIPLGRTIWNVVDVIVALGLVGLMIKEKNTNQPDD